MKYFLIIIFILVLGLPTLVNRPLYANKMSQDSSNIYKVYKIDSINSYYLIYVRKGKDRYKIVSHKDTVIQGSKIQLHKKYRLTLYVALKGVYFPPEVTCYNFAANTPICKEYNKGIYELYFSNDLSGLYYIH